LSQSTFRDNTYTLFTLQDPGTAGIEGTYWYHDTFASLRVLNRLGSEASGDEVEASYFASNSDRIGDLSFDLGHIFNYDGQGSGVFLNYYLGRSTIPTNTDAFAAGTDTSTYRNNFQRLTGYAQYFFLPKVDFIAGAGWGRDQLPNNGIKKDTLNSLGYFAGFECYPSTRFASGIRFDQMIPDTDESRSNSYSGSFYVNYRPINELIIKGEFQHLRQGRAGDEPKDNDILTARAILAF